MPTVLASPLLGLRLKQILRCTQNSVQKVLLALSFIIAKEVEAIYVSHQ